MATLSVILWGIFLADALARVESDAWVFRPRGTRPAQRGGDLTLTAIGDVVWLPLVPWGQLFVAEPSHGAGVGADWPRLDDSTLLALRCSSTALGVLLLIVLPVLAIKDAFAAWSMVWLSCTGIALGCVLATYALLRHRWHVRNSPAPWTLALSPVSAIHAPHVLLRHAFSAADPIRLAERHLAGDSLARALRQMWWDLPERRDAIAAVAAATGMSHTLTQSPPRDGTEARSFCPRCLTQYVAGPVTCRDCGNVQLTRFAP